MSDLRKKYEPKTTALAAAAAEVESLEKQLQALPANAPDEQRASLIKSHDAKEKQLQFDSDAAQSASQSDFQEAMGKLLQKFGPVAVKYAQDNGFTLLLNRDTNQEGLPSIIWFTQASDISQAVVDAYNVSSGVAAPPPSAPTAKRPATTTPHTTAPAATTPKKP